MRVRLIDISDDAEKQIVYIARVSNPNNQDNPEYEKLIKYCIEHQHWSVFEHSSMTVEIETSTAIATQILRHRSMKFQQFSQRYSEAIELMGFEPIEWRKQAEKNRQSSSGLVDPALIQDFNDAWFAILEDIQNLYEQAISLGVAKECARFVLPQCTGTKMYMTGDIRSFIHYINLRTKPDTQKEHRLVAEAIKKIFISELPVTSLALGWIDKKGKMSNVNTV